MLGDPATIQTVEAVTVKQKMRLCSSDYEKAISRKQVRKQLEVLK